MILTSLSLYLYRLPLDRFLPVGKQRIDYRAGLVLQAKAQAEGEVREQYVEIAPLSGFDIDQQPLLGFSRESLDEVQQALVALLPKLQNQSIDCLLEQAEASSYPSIAFGLSLLHAKLSGKLDTVRPVTTTVPLIYQPTDAPKAELIAKIAKLDTSVKVKVAQTSMEDELSLIYGILSQRPELKLRLDANRGFSLEQALDFAACLPLDSIEYIEEPCQQPQDNHTLHRAIPLPYALDESLNDPDYQFVMQEGLTALVIKPMLLGSIEKLQCLIDEASSHGVRCILSSSLEASLGINDLAHLAAILTPDEIPGLDTLAAFSQDLIVPSGKPQTLTFKCLKLVASTQQD
ncbi:o-succinylbenzoate synthase [Shewanella xiamenensis]|uniref:o-succinylbenzoate synthase n=1 Tax=Shewanella xiamenensis TaxID=332186 RepID=UPI001C4FC239|nr:o-succinylbenzoate synthase [Shewanella xiamenensis]MBW0279662.1 o-succinylbenzoate synthase [Shewanella xiamenensis]MCT8871865.1 o-succinylbenzoate synthase [Shewanella xiamenensis]MDH1314634.1 o-succinylbenzoate synthase [Shewanella xiamenensis]UWH42298.1 o-succinylbenzoate synthase [Shewanella xiamenensis]